MLHRPLGQLRIRIQHRGHILRPRPGVQVGQHRVAPLVAAQFGYLAVLVVEVAKGDRLRRELNGVVSRTLN